MTDPRAIVQTMISLASALLGRLAAKVGGNAAFEREAEG